MSVDGITGPKKVDGIHLSSADCDRWEASLAKHGTYELARRMARTKSWRSYAQKHSFDYSQTWEDMEGSSEVLEHLPAGGPDIVELADIRIKRQRLMDSLSAKQLAIWRLYEQGKTPAEIKEILGYNTTEAIRWQKHKMKQIWLMIRNEK